MLTSVQRHQDPDLPSYAQTIAEKALEHDDDKDDAGLPNYHDVAQTAAAYQAYAAPGTSQGALSGASAAVTVDDDNDDDDEDSMRDDAPLLLARA